MLRLQLVVIHQNEEETVVEKANDADDGAGDPPPSTEDIIEDFTEFEGTGYIEVKGLTRHNDKWKLDNAM